MKTTFLHLSDLHYCSDWAEESEVVLDAFQRDVKEQVQQFENLYLVFSGDLVQAGESDAYYADFEKRLTSILDEAGILGSDVPDARYYFTNASR